MSMATNAEATRARPMTREEKRVIMASSAGTIFEWYDFYLYGSLAAIIGAENERDILDADNNEHRPEDERQNAQYICRAGTNRVLSVKTGFDGVKRACADIAENNTDGCEGKKNDFFIEPAGRGLSR